MAKALFSSHQWKKSEGKLSMWQTSLELNYGHSKKCFLKVWFIIWGIPMIAVNPLENLKSSNYLEQFQTWPSANGLRRCRSICKKKRLLTGFFPPVPNSGGAVWKVNSNREVLVKDFRRELSGTIVPRQIWNLESGELWWKEFASISQDWVA